VSNPDPGFEVALWADRRDGNYKTGEPVVFSFKTNKDCRLTLFNVGTSGKVQILFPNEFHKDNLVKAGATYRVPSKDSKYIFKAQGPAGEDMVKAIATLEKVALVRPEAFRPSGSFSEANEPEGTITRDISLAVKPLDPRTWAEAAATPPLPMPPGRHGERIFIR
jgi:hypothetical protein